MDNIHENYIRRERQRKKEIIKVIAEMRASLKVCDMDDVRQHKLPYYQALLIGLEEKGYVITVAYIKQLIDFQTEMREAAGPSSVLWTKPQLKDSKNLLKTISECLTKAEESHNTKEYESECNSFLQIAAHVAFLQPDWWWLGEQLLLQSISISKDYPVSGGKYEALSRYAYAKFLIENIKETEHAQEQLSIARELSTGKKWLASMIFPNEKDIIYAKVNYLLHLCLMQDAKIYMKIDIKRAIKLAALARKRAREACFLEGETRALLLKGICEVTARHPSDAISSFSKAFYIQEKLGNLEGICETKLQLAQAYLMNGDTILSLQTLISSKDCARDNNLTYYLALAYKCLGEFYLNNGEPKKATPFLAEALKIFRERSNIQESELVRNLEAISTGLELFPRYIKLLSNISDPDIGADSLRKMIEWKDSRKEFWTLQEEIDDTFSEMSVSEEENTKEEENIIKEEETQLLAELTKSEEMNINEEEIVELHVNIDAFKQESNTEIAIKEEKPLAIEQNQIDNKEHELLLTNNEKSLESLTVKENIPDK